MGSAKDAWTLITDPAYPHSVFGLDIPPGLVRPALLLVALVLTVLTIWTYLGVQKATPVRVVIVLFLRLAALVAACLAVLRPSFAYKSDLQTPSILIIVVDYSESMTIQDELNSNSRWAYVQRVLRESEPAARELADKHNVTIAVYRFAGDVVAVAPEGQSDPQRVGYPDVLKTLSQVTPDGKRTDFGLMLHDLYELYNTGPQRRGLVILSDGADNGSNVKYQPLTLAAQWRTLPCPIQTFAVGDPKTSDRQSDIHVKAVDPESPFVPMKGELVIKAVIDAPGFVGATFHPRLEIDGVEVNPTKVLLDDKEVKGDPAFRRVEGNELKFVCVAPAKPGEIKVTVKVDTKDGEMSRDNNEMSTYVTVTKEGISVLFVDRSRFPEPQNIIRNLSLEKRINLHSVWFRRDESATISQTDLFKFQEQKYDVVILGDVTPGQVRSGNPQAFTLIRNLVENGAGLLFLAGDRFGRSNWNQVEELKDLLPVTADEPRRIEGPVRMKPTDFDPRDRSRFMLRLADDAKANEEHWSRLRDLAGMPPLGKLKTKDEFKDGGAPVVLAESDSGKPMLVWKPFGKGRVLVFAGDTTFRWVEPDNENGLKDYQRFWQRTVLWLARQEETESNLKIDLPNRRVPSGEAFEFGLTLHDKGGNEVKGAQFVATLIGPKGSETPLPTGSDKTGEHGTVEKERLKSPGEYRIKAVAKGKDAAGNSVDGKEDVRFLVYQDETETIRRAADHDFLKKLAATGGGEFHQADELTAYLKQLAAQPLPQARPKGDVWPDWRRNELSGFLVGFFILFVVLLSLEWFLRRRWGLV
jgi:uncharacterized membrane protein